MFAQRHQRIYSHHLSAYQQAYTSIDHIALKPHPITVYPSTNKLHISTSTCPNDNHSPDVIVSLDLAAPASPLVTALQPHMPPSVFAATITQSSSKNIFVQYTLAGTMLQRCYIVQVDMGSSARLALLDRQPDHYYCVFLAKQPVMTPADGAPAGTVSLGTNPPAISFSEPVPSSAQAFTWTHPNISSGRKSWTLRPGTGQYSAPSTSPQYLPATKHATSSISTNMLLFC